MRFCEAHWSSLRAAIDARGLTALVSEGGEAAARNLASELAEGRTLDNFDPLMAAHNAIFGNAMEFASRAGANPLVMLDRDAPPEHQCPLCFLNGMSDHHDATCVEPACRRPKGFHYEWMIDRAADEAAEAWEALRP